MSAFILRCFAPVLLFLTAGLLGAMPAHAMKFADMPLADGRYALLMYDNIGPDDDKALENRLGSRQYKEIWLSSGGGVVDTSYNMGRMIRRSRIAVRVPSIARMNEAFGRAKGNTEIFAAAGYVQELSEYRRTNMCASACGMLLAGGLVRFADEGGTVGLHSASALKAYKEALPGEIGDHIKDKEFQYLERDNQLTGVTWSAYMQEMGLDMRYVAKAASVPQQCMYYLSFSEMRNLNVINVKGAASDGFDSSYCSCMAASLQEEREIESQCISAARNQ